MPAEEGRAVFERNEARLPLQVGAHDDSDQIPRAREDAAARVAFDDRFGAGESAELRAGGEILKPTPVDGPVDQSKATGSPALRDAGRSQRNLEPERRALDRRVERNFERGEIVAVTNPHIAGCDRSCPMDHKDPRRFLSKRMSGGEKDQGFCTATDADGRGVQRDAGPSRNRRTAVLDSERINPASSGTPGRAVGFGCQPEGGRRRRSAGERKEQQHGRN